jgi:hypothetical protein
MGSAHRYRREIRRDVAGLWLVLHGC